jgi:hypothetical protein
MKQTHQRGTYALTLEVKRRLLAGEAAGERSRREIFADAISAALARLERSDIGWLTAGMPGDDVDLPWVERRSPVWAFVSHDQLELIGELEDIYNVSKSEIVGCALAAYLPAGVDLPALTDGAPGD